MDVFSKLKATDQREQEIKQSGGLWAQFKRVISRKESNCPLSGEQK